MTAFRALLRHELRLRFRQPLTLTLAVLMPLLVAALIGVTFEGVTLGQGLGEKAIRVGVVNADEGELAGALLQTLADPALLLDSGAGAAPARFTLIPFTDPAAARRQVDRERLAAALLIPPDFSARLVAGDAEIELYLSGRFHLEGMATAAAVAATAQGFALGEALLRQTSLLLAREPATRVQWLAGRFDDALRQTTLEAVRLQTGPVQLQHTISGASTPRQRLSDFLAAALAVLFIGSAALMNGAMLWQERSDGVLQRQFISPTPVWVSLLAKMLAAYSIGVVQGFSLLLGMAAVNRLLLAAAAPPAIDLAGLVLLILALPLAALGFAWLMAAAVNSSTEATYYGRVLLVLMGLLGGVFLPVAWLPDPLTGLARLTFPFWALDGFLRLTAGAPAGAIRGHVLVLVGMGAVMLLAGGRLARRRLAGMRADA